MLTINKLIFTVDSFGHMEKQETEIQQKLEKGNWKRKLETEMGTKDAPITGAIISL